MRKGELSGMERGMTGAIHVMSHSEEKQRALPVVFYLTELILDDVGVSDEHLADLLHKDLVHAIHHHRGKA